MFHHFTVAEAAAVLNVAIVVVQITYPLLTALVVVGLLRRQTNAATWSVLGRLIHASFWPLLLQTDTASWIKVDKRVKGISLLSALVGFLLAIAAIVTPLGLHSTLTQSDLEDVRFSYVRDDSAMGLATQPHGTYKASRRCQGVGLARPCPGNDDGLVYSIDNSSSYLNEVPGREGSYVTTTIASNITEMFSQSSLAEADTVANVFDIQWRAFVNYNNQTVPSENEFRQYLDGGRSRTQGRFRYYLQFMLENQTRAIEGLIISTQGVPGIGLRNHTLPPESRYGYAWTEELLWLEPHTECTSLNLTYEYEIPSPESFGGYAVRERIVDRGGLVDLPRDLPVLDLNDTQSQPQFSARSYVAAVYTNTFLAKFMNLTRPQLALGSEYLLEDHRDSVYSSTDKPQPNRIAFSRFGSAEPNATFWDAGLPGALKDFSTTNNSCTINPSCPFDPISIDPIVQGYGGGDKVNISSIGAGGGIMLGVGSMLDESGNQVSNDESNLELTPGTTWSQPMFSCISGVKASIKRVDFQLNGTSTLSNLVVNRISPIDYVSERRPLPLWAIEDPGFPWTIGGVSPFWGIVEEAARSSPGIQTAQRAEFWLPAGSSAIGDLLTYNDDAVAGAKAPLATFGTIFSESSTAETSGYQDFSGAANYLLERKWRELLKSADTAGKVVDYIWTDLMANAVVSARSTLSDSTNPSKLRTRDESTNSVLRPAASYQMGISYDWRYAIPALLFLVVYVGLIVASSTMLLSRGLSIGILRWALNQTAAGRAMTTERYQASSDVDVSLTPVWARLRGDEMIRLSKDEAGRKHHGQQEYYPVDAKRGAQVTSEASALTSEGSH